MLLALVVLHAHDNHHVTRDRQAPSDITRSDEHLNGARLKKSLDDALVLLVERLVVVANTMLQCLNKTLVAQVVEMRLKIVLLDVEESLGVIVGATVRDEIVGSEATLTTRGNEDDSRLRRRVFDDSKVRGLGHRNHQGREVRNVETLQMDVHVQRAGTKNNDQLCPERSRQNVAYLGGKLKMACEGAPIHSPRSRAFASETPQTTIRVLMSVCAET